MTENSILLGVNIDHVATLRQARGTQYPDPVEAAVMAQQAGADGITLHLREDRRHIQDADVFAMKKAMKEAINVHMNLEMAVTEEMIAIAEDVMPEHCCLVPEKREELTTEGGLDVVGQIQAVGRACERLGAKDIEVSLFIDADEKQIDAAVACGAPAIEIHTGHYADVADANARQDELNRITRATEYALDKGLIVNAGHGLYFHNVQPIAAIAGINELNIGHGLVARAVFVGLSQAVADMKALMLQARR